jgi:hypothetical protein
MAQELDPDIEARFRQAQERAVLIRVLIIISYFVLFTLLCLLGSGGTLHSDELLSSIMGPLMLILTLAIPIAGFIFDRKGWRCPKCQNYLWGFKAQINPLTGTIPLYCPYCGKRLA